jgi:hypothetical protein
LQALRQIGGGEWSWDAFMNTNCFNRDELENESDGKVLLPSHGHWIAMVSITGNCDTVFLSK